MSTSPSPAPGRPHAWNRASFLILLLFLVSMNLRPAITSLSPVLDTVSSDLGMNGVVTSWLTSIPVLCMGIFAPLAALAGSRFGVERTLTACLVLIGGAIGLRAFTDTAWSLLGTAFLAGVGMAVAGPLVSAFIKRYFESRAAAMVGVYTAGMGIGSAICAGLVVPVMRGFNGSWRAALAVWVVYAVIALIFWIPTVHRHAPAIETNVTPVRLGELPWRVPRVWLLMLVFGLQSGLYYAISTWLAPLVHENGSTLAVSGAVLTVYSVVQLVANLLAPVMVHRTGHPDRWLLVGSVVLLVGLVLLNFFSTVLTPWVGAVFVGLGIGGLFPLALLLPFTEADSPQRVNDWTSAMLFGGYIFSSLIPMLVGYIKDVLGSYQHAFIALIVLCVVLGATTFAVRPSATSVGVDTDTDSLAQ